MFTGIIEEVGKVLSARLGGSGRLTIAAEKVLSGMTPGASIAVNGVCLTVTSMTTNSFTVDVMTETIRHSNLERLATGDRVNLERPLTLGGQLGGHLVQGHIDATGKVISLAEENGATLVRIGAAPEVMRYVVVKGFIAVDGISLTVTNRESTAFGVSMVDYTRKHTILADLRVGDMVNLEIDIIAKYVEQLTQHRSGGMSVDFLREHGFVV